VKTELYNYDVYPKVFPVGQTIGVTIRPLGRHAAFEKDEPVTLDILPLLHRKMVLAREDDACLKRLSLFPNADGCLRFENVFEREQEYFLMLYRGERMLAKLSVYALEADLCARTPLYGDLHVHSIYSDGQQAPEIVAADYRQRGYDFMAITDHHNYAGSLSAMRAYEGVPLDLSIIAGEEVHLPGNDIHIVNFGGLHSVNFQLKSRHAFARETWVSPEHDAPETWCSCGKAMPEAIDDDEYRRQVEALADQLCIPDDVDRFAYASCVWICSRIREAEGLSIFAHPYWINYAYHVPESMTQHLFETKPFDAFEVLGGERYLEQNEFQMLHYMQARAQGHCFPVVGCSDCHSVYNNENAADAATIVFAQENERGAIIDAVRSGYSVAVDLISREHRLVGDLRLVRYARFLLEHYFPLHKELCYEEGRLMKAYVCGTQEDAAQQLSSLCGRTRKQRARYFKKN